jgi:hypothetical protein
VAEGARLESVYTGNRIVGSNPTPSASGFEIASYDVAVAHPRSSRFSQPLRSVLFGGRESLRAQGAARNGRLLKVVQSSASPIHPIRSAALEAVSALRMHS